MSPQSPDREMIDAGLKQVALELSADITPGYEGLQITL
jgi:hypothetical protein